MTEEQSKDVIDFLIMNGFKKTVLNSYSNGLCEIIFLEEGYSVSDNLGWCMYSDDFNIYWLIGVLTYYSLMDKNYIRFEQEEFPEIKDSKYRGFKNISPEIQEYVRKMMDELTKQHEGTDLPG